MMKKRATLLALKKPCRPRQTILVYKPTEPITPHRYRLFSKEISAVQTAIAYFVNSASLL